MGAGHLKCREGSEVPAGKTIWHKNIILPGDEIILFVICCGSAENG